MANAAAKKTERQPGPNGRKIRACDHHLRRRVLRLLDLATSLSPTEAARALEEPVSKISYQIKVLELLEMVTLVREQQVRGAVEHFYESLVREDELVRAMLDATQEEDEAV